MTALRIATVDDATALAAAAERMFRDTFASSNRAEDMDAYCSATYALERVRAELADRNRHTLLVEHEGALVGFAQLREGDAPASLEILRFYVDTPWHGRGVAQPLMAAIIEEAHARAANRLFVQVWEHNPRAIAFYSRQGFKIVGSRPFVLGQSHQTDHWMVRDLRPHASDG
jgi:ribosomal protein S18 acetylase RimI-like enzyme